jgi:uncharacterized protein
MFAAGLASGVHCVAMCGGIVAAFDARVANTDARVAKPHGRRVIPIRNSVDWGRRMAFNAGRISTYAAAGAAAGAFGAAAYAASALPGQDVLAIAASLMLVLVGLHLAGGRALARLEALGAPLWRCLQSLAARLLPGSTPLRAYAAGLVWGWLPCAMAYAALLAAAASGNAARGALAMAAFGAGTLPFLLAAGWLATRLRAWRAAAGALVLGFGVYGLAQAEVVSDGIRRGLLCL